MIGMLNSAARLASTPDPDSVITCSAPAPARSDHASAAPSRDSGRSSSNTHASPSVHQRRAGGERVGLADGVVRQVVAHQCSQLDPEQPATTVGGCRLIGPGSSVATGDDGTGQPSRAVTPGQSMK